MTNKKSSKKNDVRRSFTCSICNKEHFRDRYEGGFEYERQDIPYNSLWQKSCAVYVEDVCRDCILKLENVLSITIQKMRENKGRLE